MYICIKLNESLNQSNTINAQPLTPNNPNFDNFCEVIEDTIIRYTKNGRWYELHRTSAMLAMFGIEKGTSFEDVPTTILKSIIYNFHESHGFDVTVEMNEEAQQGYSYHK